MNVRSAFRRRRAGRGGSRVVAGVALAGLAGVLVSCAASPPVAPPAPSAGPAPSTEPPPMTSSRVYVYPAAGQSQAQLDRDRYECYLWAVEQTGFDPSQPQAAPHQRVEVVPMPPPGTSTAAGAATGAIIGAAVSSPRHTGEGAAVGAVAGAIIGATADAARQQQAEQAQRAYDQRDAELAGRLERQSSEYRRAISACLEGRGYTVK